MTTKRKTAEEKYYILVAMFAANRTMKEIIAVLAAWEAETLKEGRTRTIELVDKVAKTYLGCSCATDDCMPGCCRNCEAQCVFDDIYDALGMGVAENQPDG